jgi:hypothetical protein
MKKKLKKWMGWPMVAVMVFVWMGVVSSWLMQSRLPQAKDSLPSVIENCAERVPIDTNTIDTITIGSGNRLFLPFSCLWECRLPPVPMVVVWPGDVNADGKRDVCDLVPTAFRVYIEFPKNNNLLTSYACIDMKHIRPAIADDNGFGLLLPASFLLDNVAELSPRTQGCVFTRPLCGANNYNLHNTQFAFENSEVILAADQSQELARQRFWNLIDVVSGGNSRVGNFDSPLDVAVFRPKELLIEAVPVDKRYGTCTVTLIGILRDEIEASPVVDSGHDGDSVRRLFQARPSANSHAKLQLPQIEEPTNLHLTNFENSALKRWKGGLDCIVWLDVLEGGPPVDEGNLRPEDPPHLPAKAEIDGNDTVTLLDVLRTPNGPPTSRDLKERRMNELAFSENRKTEIQ